MLSCELAPEALGIYRNRTLGVLRQFLDKTRSSAWNQLSILDHTDVMIDVFRLYGDDPWTSSAIRDIIDRSFPSTMSFRLKADKTHSEIASTLPTSALATHLLSTPLRSIFSPTPHPMLNPTSSRALSRPAGGADAQSDFHDSTTQLYKSHAGWGCYNILSWCTSQLSPDELEKRIGVVLPPTLVMMDDYEAAWRGRGVSVLKGWMDKVSVVVMSRMGMDKLLLDSLIHTLSLHANPPLPHVLPVALRLIERSTSGARRAERYAEIMDKAVIQGWTYAPLGQEGRPMLINIAKELELLCSTCGVGITRWLKVRSLPLLHSFARIRL